MQNQAMEKFKELIKNELNNSEVFVNNKIGLSPRMVGDTIQEIVEQIFAKKLPKEIGVPIDEKFARRAMADLAFTDASGKYVIVDVKTHNEETKFNMPNLISVERLARFYMDDENTFSILVIKYTLKDNRPVVSEVIFEPIEKLDWSCLTVGALGWGQIQIANSNIIRISEEQTRKTWMLELCDAIDIFYPKEIVKIKERIEYFVRVREFWEGK
jgi:hypothetical protein